MKMDNIIQIERLRCAKIFGERKLFQLHKIRFNIHVPRMLEIRLNNVKFGK